MEYEEESTLYLKTIQNSPEGSKNIAAAAASGQMFGVVTSASLGDASVSYDTSAATQLTSNWGQWNLTAYGQQYASLAKMMCPCWIELLCVYYVLSRYSFLWSRKTSQVSSQSYHFHFLQY